MSEKFWENFETIDNESINNNLDKLEAFIKQKEVNQTILNILNKIDANNPQDIDMAFNPYDEKYYIKIDGEINKKWLTAEELITKYWTPTDNPEIKNNIEINETEEDLLNQITEIYQEMKNNPSKELKNKAEELEQKYYRKSWFPVPFNEDWEMFVPIE